MGEVMEKGDKIEGVVIQPLKQIADERGMVMHMLRSDSPLFNGFGEIYFSTVNYRAVKAWKKHTEITQHYAVPYGEIKLVIFDDRQDSPTRGTGVEQYCLVVIPPGVWYGFQGRGEGLSVVANCINRPHSPGEGKTIDTDNNTIPYQW